MRDAPRRSDVVTVEHSEQPIAPLDPPQGKWLSRAEASAHFGKSERTIRHWLAEGRLFGYQEPGKGFVAWRIWSVEGEKGPAESLRFCTESETSAIEPLPALVPPPSDVVTIAREQFAELLTRHELACARIGALEEALRDRLPALEAKCTGELGTFGEELGTLRGELGTLPAEVKALAAAGEAQRRWIRRRLQGVAAALMVLAVLLAVVGGMVLTRRPAVPVERTPRPTRRLPRTTWAPDESRAAPASSAAGARAPSGSRS